MKVKENMVIVTGFVPKTFTNDEKSVLNFSLGIDDSYFKKDDNGGGEWVNKTSWVPCRVFDKKRIENLFGKIDKCEVQLRAELKSNKREVNGKDVYEVYLLANRIQILNDKKDSSDTAVSEDNIEINMEGIDEN